METITNAAFENAMKKQPPADTSTLKDLFTGAGNTYKIPKEMHTAYTSALKKENIIRRYGVEAGSGRRHYEFYRFESPDIAGR